MTVSEFINKWLDNPKLPLRSWWLALNALERRDPELFWLQIDAGLLAIASDAEAAKLFFSLDKKEKERALRLSAAGVWQKEKIKYSFEEQDAGLTLTP